MRSFRIVSSVVSALAFLGALAPTASSQTSEDGVDPARAVASSFTGLAQAPEANLFVGSASTRVEIDLPPGRRNATPKLALVYSGGGPSPYGYGWDLPLGRVQRTGKHGVLSCSDMSLRDDFVLALPSGSIECRLESSLTNGLRRCLPRIEDAFVRIYHRPGDNSFEAWDRSGIHYLFGSTPTTRTGGVTSSPWVDGSGGAPCRYTSSWALDRVVDPNGNHIDLGYEAVEGVLYPTAITYGGNVKAGMGHPFRVAFGWAVRPDFVVNAIGGFPATLTRVLDRIDVHAPGAAPLRSYRFGYDFAAASTIRLARTSFLTSVTLVGRGGQALARADGEVASTLFSYQEPGPGGLGFNARSRPRIGTTAAFRHETGGDNHRYVRADLRDMNRDGFVDYVEDTDCGATGTWRVYLGSRDGFAGTPISWRVPVIGGRCPLTSMDLSDSGDVMTVRDVLDLDGDGLVDLVDASTRPWKVYFGRVPSSSQGWGFDLVPTSWVASGATADALRATDKGRDWLDLVDWNGDGLADLMDARAGRVYRNTGTGFEISGLIVHFQNQRFRHAKEKRTVEGLYDVNGDGLPDFVRAPDDQPYWEVYLNNGRDLGASQRWAVPPNIDVHEGSIGGISDKGSTDAVWRDLVDMNSDGLPDLVDVAGWTPSFPYWRVYLNRGDEFQLGAVDWYSPTQWLRHDQQCPGTENNVCTVTQVTDVDGDGLVDVLDYGAQVSPAPVVYRLGHNAGGAWAVGCGGSCVVANGAGSRSDLLVRVENGLGATTSLSYRPSTDWDNRDSSDSYSQLGSVLWTVTNITAESGLSGLVPGASATSTSIRYSRGKYDPELHEFLGFGTVYTADALGTQRVTLFEQDTFRRGRIEQERVLAPGVDPTSEVPLTATVNRWVCADPAKGTAKACPTSAGASERAWVRLAESRAYTYDQADLLYKSSLTENLDWDAYGNVVRSRTSADATPTVDTYSEYIGDDAVEVGRYQVDKPRHLKVVSGAKLEEKWFFYDQRGYGEMTNGNVTRVESWLDRSAVAAPRCTVGSSLCLQTTTEYDAYGNVTRVTDALNRSVATVFDVLRLYPERITNALGHVVVSAYDAACGKLLWQTQPGSSLVVVHGYDDFCRLSSTTAPGESDPDLRVHYYLGAPGVPTDVHVARVEPSSPTGWNGVDQLSDAMGRPLQTLRDGSVNGARVVIAEQTSEYDARGQVVAASAPFLTTLVLGSGGVAAYRPAPGDERSRYERDALGRVIRTTMPDGAETTADYSVAWQTVRKDACYNAGGCVGSMSVETQNAAGLVLERKVYQETSTGSVDLKAGTQYEYDGAGRLKRSRQWAESGWSEATAISITYDSVGRKVQLDDPDSSGPWRYGYDLAGNLVYQDDPKAGQHVQFCYDGLNRVTQKHLPPNDAFDAGACSRPDEAAVVYTYDSSAGGVGHVALVEERDSEGAPRGATYFDDYDPQGHPRVITKDVVVDSVCARASTIYGYDRAGHLESVLYPDNELVGYVYDDAGLLQSILSSTGTTYLRDQVYDRFGRATQTAHGNGVVDVREHYGADKQFRLSHLYVSPPSGTAGPCGAMYLDLTYPEYTATGLIRAVSDAHATCGTLSNSATYAYDGLGRLTQVSGNSALNAAYTHSAIGNLTAKDGRAITYATTSRPHSPSAVGSVSLHHDDNGNRDQKGGVDAVYDSEDHLISYNGGQVRFGYDYGGRKVWERSASGARIYFSELAEHRRQGGWGVLTKHYFAGARRLASREVLWDPSILVTSAPPSISVAGRPGRLGLQVAFAPGIGRIAASALGVALLGMLTLPEVRRRRVVGMIPHRGRILALVLVFSATGFPIPCELLIRPAYAGGGGGLYNVSVTPVATSTATRAATRTPTPSAPTPQLLHYHTDHLGSPQVVTDARGGIVQMIRYKPYGEPRGRWDAQLRSTTAVQRYEFTGYESQEGTDLQYASMRYYDPDVGMFLSHDPARQFLNPYAYGPGEPINGTDPTGSVYGLLVMAAVFASLAATAAGIDAAVRSGSVVAGLKAVGVSLASSSMPPGSSFGLQLLAPATFGKANSGTYALSMVPYVGDVYGAVRGFKSGDYATGAVAILSLAYALYSPEEPTGGAGADNVVAGGTDPDTILGLELWESKLFDRTYGDASGNRYAGSSMGDVTAIGRKVTAVDFLSEMTELARDFHNLRNVSMCYQLFNAADVTMQMLGYGGRLYGARLDYVPAGKASTLTGDAVGVGFPSTRAGGAIGAYGTRSIWVERVSAGAAGPPLRALELPADIGRSREIYIGAT